MRVVGIDPGYVNFAVCGISSTNMLKPYYWSNTALFKGDFSEERLANAIYTWIKSPEIKALLDNADVIVIERQMTMKFQAINHCVRFLYFDKTKEVNPNTLRAFFQLPVKRKEKKKAAVDLVKTKAVFPVQKGKKDDLADAYLVAIFHLLNSKEILRNEWDWEGVTKKLKHSNLAD